MKAEASRNLLEFSTSEGISTKVASDSSVFERTVDDLSDRGSDSGHGSLQASAGNSVEVNQEGLQGKCVIDKFQLLCI